MRIKMKRKHLGGIIPATITPFKEDGTLNEEALLKLMDWNQSQGAEGFFIGGSSGECFLLSSGERNELFAAAAARKETAYLIAHVGAISVKEAKEYTRCAVQEGFDAIAATPPFYYGFDSRSICRYYYEIAEEAGMPVIIYNFPANTGKKFDVTNPDYQELFRSGAILGVKHTNQEVYQMERIKNLNPDLILMNGFDETMAAGIAMGADGSIGSTFNFMYPHYRELYETCLRGEREKALALQRKANNVMSACCEAGLIPSIKYLLTEMGIDAGEARLPFLPLTGTQKKSVIRAAEENGILDRSELAGDSKMNSDKENAGGKETEVSK